MTTGVISALSTKDVTTKFGVKKTYSAQIDGDWYSFGFKDPKVGKGDTIDFEFTTSTYGNQIDVKTVRKVGSTPASAEAPSAPRSTGGGYSKGVFPIPAFDGQRSILRQNALTNARELFQQGKKDVVMDSSTAMSIINMARIFESYTAGDLDVEEAAAEVAAE